MHSLPHKLQKGLFLFLIGAAWDAFMTIYGTLYLLGQASIPALFAGLLVTLIVIFFFYFTFDIFPLDANSDAFNNKIDFPFFRGHIMIGLIKLVWWICLLYNMWTSFIGNRAILLGGEMTIAGFLVLFMMTSILTGCTILASWILFENRKKTTS